MFRNYLYAVKGVALVLLCCSLGATAQYDNCVNGTITDIGDGHCNAENNNPSCDYDGGDVSVFELHGLTFCHWMVHAAIGVNSRCQYTK